MVDKHWRAISEEVGISRERVEKAIANLEAADPDSRSPEEEGRRIVKMDEHRIWGWRIVNYGKYRSIRSEEDRRTQNRAAQERWRNKQNKPRKPPSAQAEAEAEAEAEALKKDHSTRKPSAERGTRLTDAWQLTEELRGFASDLGLEPQQMRDEFVDYWTAVPGSKGLKLDWAKTFKNRCRDLGKKSRQPVRGEDWNQRRIREAKEAIK
jgi:hypothetical protein